MDIWFKAIGKHFIHFDTMKGIRDLQIVEPANRAEWRQWLAKNHTQKESIWLAVAKKGHNGVSVSEAVEEALCFGWIDSTANKLDDKRYKLLLAPRKRNSVWSKINKARVSKLIKAKLMQPPGMAMIKLAKKTGTWKSLNDIDNLKSPDDLTKAFSRNKKAKAFFDAFPPSTKKQILYWITSAKTLQTRNKRIKETVSKAAKNERANQYIQKEK
jgi:uncharacterized protein YdeI (YjbR/CyaY-like superfamily)